MVDVVSAVTLGLVMNDSLNDLRLRSTSTNVNSYGLSSFLVRASYVVEVSFCFMFVSAVRECNCMRINVCEVNTLASYPIDRLYP